VSASNHQQHFALASARLYSEIARNDPQPFKQRLAAVAREETGVLIDHADLAFSHVVHHRSPDGQGRIDFFFTAVRWQGEPANLEPHKCAGLHWADPARPPANTVPFTAAALAAITGGASFSLDGW
jgi:8-oxo-dGTP diphosphatase